MSDIHKIIEAAQTIPSFERSKGATKEIVNIFTELGSRLGYDSGPGWLYDVCWSTEDSVENGKMMSRIPMALESELDPDHHLDGDFQKLVQARADVRVWIANCPDARLSIDACKEQIRLFAETRPGDQYVFAVYDRKSQRAIIEEYRVPQSK